MDAFTGRLLDCKYTFEIKGLRSPRDLSENNGGHIHNFDTHPLIEPPQPPLGDGKLGVVGGDFQYVNNLLVSGQTRNQEVEITHQMPQVAGVIETEIFIYAPYGDGPPIPCYSHEERSYRAEGTIDVKVPGLTQLPDSGDYHVVCRSEACPPPPSSGASHPYGTYGTQDTVNKLLKIAEKYYEFTDGRKLSINDLSLPKGGLFDYKATWAPPHTEHRTGNDADINLKDGGGVRTTCETDKDLKKAIAEVAKGQSRPKLKSCDIEGEKKHIDFD